MPEPKTLSLQALSEEIEGLRFIQRSLVVALIFATAILVLFLMQPGPSDRVGASGALEVRALHLVDDQGVVRATLGLEGGEETVLRLADPDGNARLALRVGAAHSTLELTSARQHTLARLSAIDGLSALHLTHEQGAQTAQLQAGVDSLSLMLADLDRGELAVFEVGESEKTEAPGAQP